MLSRPSRTLLLVVAVLFGALGVVLYLAPGYSAVRFPWRVSNFLAMTMGAWYLGSALFAWRAVKDPKWSRSFALLLYLWVFSVGQALVLVVHAGDLRTDATLTWPYVVVIGVAAVAALVGAFDVARSRPRRQPEGAPLPGRLRAIPAAFSVAVLLLALPLLNGYDNPRSTWPGQLTLPSARSFAVFFAALSLSAAPLAFARGAAPLASYLRAGLVLNVTILAAAAVYFERFDLGDHPGQFLYLGLYAFVLVAALALLSWVADRPT